MQPVYFITGTDTGVGKTVLTALWAAYLHRRKVNVAAYKPLCSGGREDAEALHAALGGTLALDEINPWHFRAPLAPLLAARIEKKTIKLAQVRAHIRSHSVKCNVVLVEGAGGLLSPMGEDFDSRDLLLALRATPIIVAANKLGVVNHIRLTLEALPKKQRAQAVIVLMFPAKSDAATSTNAKLLAEFTPAKNILLLPWLGKKISTTLALKNPQVKRTLRKLSRV
ncbi:MAG TPA: dethiobiotin synthase [Verrucomicrobiae bacterium]|nr:dethiobiotin synthase [Verrucomicrobiae bacterium]